MNSSVTNTREPANDVLKSVTYHAPLQKAKHGWYVERTRSKAVTSPHALSKTSEPNHHTMDSWWPSKFLRQPQRTEMVRKAHAMSQWNARYPL